MIRTDDFYISEERSERIWKRQVPAWVISGGIHLMIMVVFLLSALRTPAHSALPIDTMIETRVMEDKPEKQNFDNTDIGNDPNKATNYNNDRIEEISVPGKVLLDQPIGIEGAPQGMPQTVPPPPGFGGGQGGGLDADKTGLAPLFNQQGGFVGGRLMPGIAFAGRSGATRQKMVEAGGGNSASEAAVAKGLQWLQRQQKADGRWTMIEGSGQDDLAATGLALLPFLAAGHTHKPIPGEKASTYTETVRRGVKYLVDSQKANGLLGSDAFYKHYSHAICAMALSEAYGMTGDPYLKKPAQRAIDYLVKIQHSGGGFRYQEQQPGDTSVTGWCLQALKSGMLSGLSVPHETFYKVSTFLDSVQRQNGASYGYTGPADSLNMTAVALLCRQYLGWGPKNPNLIAGVENLKKNPPTKGRGEIYYYYYATQVVHFFGGDDWKLWNEGPNGKAGMRDLLIEKQDNSTGPNRGSWPAERGTNTGNVGGRLCATSLSLLTLEVYYRHLPLYKRDSSGMKEIE